MSNKITTADPTQDTTIDAIGLDQFQSLAKVTGTDAMETETGAMFEGWPGPLHDLLPTLPPLSRLGWEEEYAYSLGVQAYIYGFPWIYLSQLRWLWTTEAGKKLAEAKGLFIPWAPLNTFYNAPILANPDTATGGSPNCDTLYSVAWLDVGKQPIVLHVPEVKDRYYCMQMACIDSDNFAYVGTYATGTAEGNYLIGGPGWKGAVPDGVLDVLPRSRTPAVLILGRTGVNNDSQAELDRAGAIQKCYALTPLCDWPNEPREHPTHVQVPVGIDYNDTRGAWLTMNRAMTENPPGVLPGINQTQLLTLFATIGVGPNQRLEDRSRATIVGLQRAAKDGLALLKKMAEGRGKVLNYWTYPPRDVGQAGQNSDFITRAAVQALAGIADHYPAEAVYINTTKDSDGNDLVSSGEYVFTFDPKDPQGGFPSFDETYHGFWSVTLYQTSNFNLVAGSKSYTINSYDPKYSSRQDDGSLTVRLQRNDIE